MMSLHRSRPDGAYRQPDAAARPTGFLEKQGTLGNPTMSPNGYFVPGIRYFSRYDRSFQEVQDDHAGHGQVARTSKHRCHIAGREDKAVRGGRGESGRSGEFRISGELNEGFGHAGRVGGQTGGREIIVFEDNAHSSVPM